ncbi:hypothetical protein D3C74_415400 [compost metagenome]
MNILMFQQTVHDIMCTVYNVEHAIRKPCFLEQLCQAACKERCTLGRFQDKGVTACNSQREHPARHHHREVERGNSPNNSDWVTIHA